MDLGSIVAIVTLALGGLGLLWRVSAKATEAQAQVVAAEATALRAQAKADSVHQDLHPRVSALELHRAGDRATAEAFGERLAELAADVKELLRRTASRG